MGKREIEKLRVCKINDKYERVRKKLNEKKIEKVRNEDR
jgi:hypothetical protein